MAEEEIKGLEEVEEQEEPASDWGSLKMLDTPKQKKTCIGCSEQRKGYAFWRNSGIIGRFGRFKTYTVGPLC